MGSQGKKIPYRIQCKKNTLITYRSLRKTSQATQYLVREGHPNLIMWFTDCSRSNPEQAVRYKYQKDKGVLYFIDFW